MEEELGLPQQIQSQFGFPEADIRTYSPLTLAFLGDCVFEIVIRTVMVERGNRQIGRMNKEKARMVNAATQARMAEVLEGEFSEEEAEVYRRGRNAKIHAVARNASVADYRKATGLEALCGYLYLKGCMPRVLELIGSGLHKLDITL